MTLNDIMALILRYFTEFVYDVAVKSSCFCSLSRLLMSSLLHWSFKLVILQTFWSLVLNHEK